MHLAVAAKRYERDTLDDTGLESHRGARRDIEPVPVGGFAVERQRRVGLRQVDVAADLHRTVAGVHDVELEALRTLIEDDVAVAEDDLSRNHSRALLTESDRGR